MMDTAMMDDALADPAYDPADPADDRGELLTYFNPAAPPIGVEPRYVAPPPGHPWGDYGPLAGLDEQAEQVQSALVTEHDCPRCESTGIEPAPLWKAANAACTLCLGVRRVGRLRPTVEALQTLGPLLVASLAEGIQAMGGCPEIPLLRQDPEDPLTILAPLLEYRRLDGRRRIEGWTVGTLHPLAVVCPNGVTDDIIPREGRTLWLAEGIVPRALDAEKRRECKRIRQEYRRDGWMDMRVENADRCGEDLLDALVEQRIFGDGALDLAALGLDLAALGLDTDAEEVHTNPGGSAGMQARFLSKLSGRLAEVGPEADLAFQALVASPWRHELIAARVAAEVQRVRRRAHRIVLPWGIGHAGGLERDVWTPNGFHLFRVSWWRAARLEWPLGSSLGPSA